MQLKQHLFQYRVERNDRLNIEREYTHPSLSESHSFVHMIRAEFKWL